MFLKDYDRCISEAQTLSTIGWKLLQEISAAVSMVPLSNSDRKGTALLHYDIEHEGVPL